jgi:serine/threonine-protein kinase
MILYVGYKYAMAGGSAAGTLVGERYRLSEKLGSGGMAVVWRGFDTVLGRRVAVKILKDEAAADSMIAGRLRKEAWAVAQLTHPNITQVYDYGSDVQADGSTRAFVVMELAEGRSLQSLLADGAALPWRRATAIVAQVAAALAAAHQRGIVHRDVTPNNIMVGPDGVKVLDFGIAALFGENDASQATPAELLGTPAYVAPERLLDPDGPVGPAVDMYALGMVWYRMLTGRLPWSTNSRDELLMAHINQAPSPLAATVGLPPELADLCARCLAKDAADRPTSAQFSARVSSHDLTGAALAFPTANASAEPVVGTEPLAGPVTQTQTALPGRPDGTSDPAHVGSAPFGRRRRERLALVAASLCGGLAVAMAYLLYGLKVDASGSPAGAVVVGGTTPPTTTSAPVDASAAPTAGESPSATASTPPDVAAPAPVAVPAATAPDPTLAPTPTATVQGTPVSGLGGTAWMSCPDRTNVVIESTAPNAGYTLSEARFGPAKDVKAVFVSGPRRTEVRGKCEAGALKPEVVER